ncbi:MAG: DUF4129 domain-containing protein [Gemmatimonadaceae bacterium]
MQLDERAIRDTAEAVFSARAYNSVSLFDRFWAWLGEQVRRLFSLLEPLWDGVRGFPPLYWAVIALLALVVLGAVWRAIHLWSLRREAIGSGVRWGDAAGRGGDPWRVAQEEAARGNFTEAAHALYQALLESAARQGQVRLHPSKTVGDYVRELRGRSSALFSRFREFARSYEVVIYGIGVCDRERYERLLSLAMPIVRPNE